MPHPTHQHRHIRTLPAPVGVQLIKNQKLQSLRRPDHLLILRVLARKDVFQHHIVREQDIGRIVLDHLLFCRSLLPCVASKSDPFRAFGIAQAEVLLQLLELAVAQGIHRVDDDRPYPLAGIACFFGFDDALHHRQDVADRFA